MNDIFKYLLFILIISLIIAILCCNHHHIEGFSEFPFDSSKNEDVQSFEKLQDMIFKYESVQDSGKSGAIQFVDHRIDEGIPLKKEYKKLNEDVHGKGDYMPYEKILPDTFSTERVKPKVKTQKAVIKVEADIENKTGDLRKMGVQERSKSGSIYFEPNSCIGGWSDWNKENCGDKNSRCGIQFKKYEIIEAEKNDENGPGKPCEYKDGEIKYRYCFGLGNDDYESNNERCGTVNNSCPCKLSNDNVMVLDGENVYDLEDDCKFERNIDCLCPPGYSIVSKDEICKLTPGVDCSIEEPGCVYIPPTGKGGESCNIPNFINEKAEKDFYNNYLSFDGKCKEKKCYCNHGKAVEGEDCLIDGFELCDLNFPCDEGYYYEGNPPRCKEQTDKNECNCLNGSPGSEGTNTRCSPTETANSDKRIQFCSVNCSPGFKHEQQCDDYYETTMFNNVSCCVPEFNRCKLDEQSLINKNIVRKITSNRHTELLNSSLFELKNTYADTIDNDIDFDTILKEDNPKQYLISEILKNDQGSDEDTKECVNRISLKKCMNNFKCKEGYAFLPSKEYASENELRIVTCEGSGEFNDICIPSSTNCEVEKIVGDSTTAAFSAVALTAAEAAEADAAVADAPADAGCKYPSNTDVIGNIVKCSPPILDSTTVQGKKCEDCELVQEEVYQPIWNGTCVPVNCPIDSNIKELYNIPYDSCSSKDDNCGLSNITCKKEEYDVSNTNKMIYCRVPYKVDSSYTMKDYELIHLGCSLNPPSSEAKKEKLRRMKQGSNMISEGDAEMAKTIVSRTGISTENIDTEADFRGTTAQAQLDLETQLEKTRIEIEDSLQSEFNVERDITARERLQQRSGDGDGSGDGDESGDGDDSSEPVDETR